MKELNGEFVSRKVSLTPISKSTTTKHFKIRHKGRDKPVRRTALSSDRELARPLRQLKAGLRVTNEFTQ